MTGPPSEDSAALRALARALAPYLVDELRSYGLTGRSTDPTLDPDYDDATARRYVEGLGRDVIDRAIELFSALSEPPHRIDSVTLADRVGAVSPRDLPGILTTPLKRRADTLGLPWPWDTDDTRGRTVWRARDPGMAARILDALEHASRTHQANDLPRDPAETAEVPRPAPSAVFVWSHASLQGLTETSHGSSVLRSSRPGSRAVIYRAEQPAAIVALFDVATNPEPHEKWRWHARGAFHLLEQPITRDELIAVDELRPIFANISSRRRLPPHAQNALRELIEQRYPDARLPPLKALAD
jgi:hypothetical protein